MFEEYENKQPIAYKVLKKFIDKNEYNHAYLIETNGYEDSFDFVISFVKEIFLRNCNNEYDYDHICDMINENNYPELRIINPDGLWIKKEQLKNLQEEFKKKAITGNKKIYIINNADRLNMVSSNSILKFLEEPQEGIIAILICENRYKLLETIISRCQIVTLNGQADFDSNSSLLLKIGQIVTKSKDDYNNFIENKNNNEKISKVLEFIKYYENNGYKIICYINKYWNNYFQNKEAYYLGLVILLTFYQDLLSYKLDKKIMIFNEYVVDIEKYTNKNSINSLSRKIGTINNAIEKIDYNANLNLLMDKLIIEMEGD